MTVFGGYTRPAKEAHRSGGSPGLEGQTGLTAPRTKVSHGPSWWPPLPGLCTPRHAVTHPPVAGAAQHACQLGCEAAAESLRRGRGARPWSLLLREAGPGGGNHPAGDRKPRPQHGRAQRARWKPLHRRPVTRPVAPPVCSHSPSRPPNSRGTRDPAGASHVRRRAGGRGLALGVRSRSRRGRWRGAGGPCAAAAGGAAAAGSEKPVRPRSW